MATARSSLTLLSPRYKPPARQGQPPAASQFRVLADRVLRTERPIYLIALAAAFLIATFLDGVNLLAIPVAENPANVLGVILTAAFLATRLSAARLWAGPARYFWLFIGLTAVLELGRYFMEPAGGAKSLRNYAQYAQVFLLYLIIYDLCRSARAVKVLMATFVLSAIVMSLVANLGLGGLVGSTQIHRTSEAERLGVLGMNLNLQGFIYAAAVTGIMCWCLARWPRLTPLDWVLVGGAASMVLALLRTGSRGGLLVLAAGLGVALLLMFRGRRWTAYLVLVPVALYGLGSAVMSSDLMRLRFEQAIYEGRLGSRDMLAREGVAMFLERPGTGWGCTYAQDLGLRVGRERIAAHNTYLQVAISFGLLGFLPWVLGVGATFLRLWQYRTQFWGSLMLAVLTSLLVAAIPGNLSYNKYTWMILAVAGAMPFHVPLPFKGTKTSGPSSRSPTPGRTTLRSRLRHQQRP